MKHYNIPIFVPHEGCPFDCIFCNQRKITGADTSISSGEVSKIIEEHLKTLPQNNRVIEAAFFGGSFTGISADKQELFLKAAYEYVKDGRIDGIRLSTRPDYINEEVLERLLKYGVTTIELGVQSMIDSVLAAAVRGHTAKTVENAVEMIRRYPFRLGLQMMTGLPGDTDSGAMETAQKIIAQKPDFVRIYPTLVLKDTALARLYDKGEYTPQTLSGAVSLCKRLLLEFKKSNIDVIRISLATTDEICENGSVIAGPFHSAFRELVEGEIYYDEMVKIIDENPSAHIFCVNTGEVSKAVGNGRINIKKIKERYGFNLKIKPDDSIEKGRITVWKE